MESKVTDTVDRIVRDCEHYWAETDVPTHTVEDMGIELRSHLRDALADGRRTEDVTGPDLAAFAEDWAREARKPGTKTFRSWDDLKRAKPQRSSVPSRRISIVLYGTAISAIVIAIVLSSGEGSSVEDNEIWRWVWTGLAMFMGIGEIFTAGFFLLPFAVGGVAAAILAWVGANVLAQWITFLAVSASALFYLQKYVRRQDEKEQPRVGANRYVGAKALVLAAVDPVENAGRVRVETEEWRATTDGDRIKKGAVVRVIEVRGTRLVVSESADYDR